MDALAAYQFVHEEQEICGIRVTPITDEAVEHLPSVVDRFFTRYYYIKTTGAQSEPYMVLFHSNRICLICLAPEHSVFAEGVAAVTFDIGNTDRSQNQVKGKGKKGGMILQADSSLALVTGHNGVQYKVPSCIRGKLIEVSDRIVPNPALLAKEGDGYLAIVLPKPEHCEELKNNLMSVEQYREWVLSRSVEAKVDEEMPE